MNNKNIFKNMVSFFSPKDSRKKLLKRNLLFKEIGEDIRKILEKKFDSGVFPGEDEGLTLIEGIFMPLVQESVSHEIMLGGPVVPTIGVVGKRSGRIYYFALKKLLPDIGF